MSQPAVSNAIKSMEQQVGFPLFERINNRLFPTAEAQVLYEDAEPLFNIRNSLDAKLHDLREIQAGYLRLLSTPPLGYGAIPMALRRFLASRPKVKVFFDVRRFEHVIESVETRIVDLGLVLGYDDQPDLESAVVFNGEMVCVFRADHPLAAKETIAPADLVEVPFIALERGSRLGTLERQAFSQSDCPFNFNVEVRYCQTACVLAEQGVGAAVVDPFSAAFGTWRDLVFRPFLPATPVTAHAVWLKGRPLARLAEAFLKEMRAAAVEAGY
jgi:DNA-binding transcriptional LysR family regulator